MEKQDQNPAYITIVEGPPPEFSDVANEWSIGVLEGYNNSDVALCQMRAFDGEKLVKRCHDAWREGRPALLDFPAGDGTRGELDIVAIRNEKIDDGDKLYLWVKV